MPQNVTTRRAPSRAVTDAQLDPASPASAGALILGIDPGLRRSGYAVLSPAAAPREARLVEAGVIHLRRQVGLAWRLVELENSLRKIIETHGPQILACEELYAHYRHPRTAILMAHARGVILAFAVRHGLTLVSVAATNVKKLITGNGHAAKRQVQSAVAATLNLRALPEPHDVADAIAIALAGLRLHTAQLATAAAARRTKA